MRPDMKKVVVERPRWGSRQRNRKFGARLKYVPDHDYDEQPKKPRGFESYGVRGKEFTDVLGPLQRFLEKNVGRPWNDVYSEMCACLDKRKATGKHIFDHAMDMVETNCFFSANGKVCCRRWGSEREVDGLYVHPRTGLLCCPRPESKRKRNRRELLAQEVQLILLDNQTGYRKHNGQWYRVKLRHVILRWSDPESAFAVYDIFLKETVRLGYGEYWIATEKKQCNRDELKDVQRLLAERKQKIIGM